MDAPGPPCHAARRLRATRFPSATLFSKRLTEFNTFILTLYRGV